MWVFGNGESRSNINITSLAGPKVGCNAIMRDFVMDYLVCVDRRMINEAIDRKVNEHSLVYTRKDWLGFYKNNKSIREVPNLPYRGNQRWDEPFHWGSGPYAVLIASLYDKECNVKLLGFDLYGTNQQVNNVYKNTQGYDKENKSAVDPSYWIHQIGMLFQCFPKIEYTVYQPPGWTLPKAWIHSNVTVDNISNIYYNT